MAKGICSIEGCDRPHKARGWCEWHYKRWRRHGNPLWQRPLLAERFWAKVDVRGPDECWPWTGSGNGEGYGRFRDVDGRLQGAHVIAYTLSIGPVAGGLYLDHACHNVDVTCIGGTSCPHRACCNPAHLEPVTFAVNVARGRVGAHNARKTHCPQGHPLSGDNLYMASGCRQCRACRRVNGRAYEQRQRESRMA